MTGGIASDNTGTPLSSLSVTMEPAVVYNAAIVCYVFVGGTSQTSVLTSITDNQNNSYRILDKVASTDGDFMASAELGNITNFPGTITVHFSPATPYVSMACDEYAGVAMSSEIDGHMMQALYAIGTAANAAGSGNVTTTAVGDFVSGGIADATGAGSSWTAGTSPLPFTLRQTLAGSGVGIATEDAPQAAAGSVAATFTQDLSGEDVIVAAVALKPAPGYFVATNGSDGNAGTIDAPWATLAHAQSVMQQNSCLTNASTGPCITYLRAGTYDVTSTLALAWADSGTTYSYYPPDGVNSAVLDGGNSIDLISLNQVRSITIDGIKMQHVFDYAIFTPGGSLVSKWITIANCDIGFNQSTSAVGGFNPMIFIDNAMLTIIDHNYIHDTASQGVGLYAYNTGESIDGSRISGNAVLRAVQVTSDGGSIYINMHGTHTAGGSVTVRDNLVRDYGSASLTNDVVGIYLDDTTSNTAVTGNVVAPPCAGCLNTGNRNNSTCFLVNDDSFAGASANETENDDISGNICDLGASSMLITALWGGENNTLSGNIVVSNFTGSLNTSASGVTGYAYYESSVATGLTLTTNAYLNYASGGSTFSNGFHQGDANPQTYSASQLGLSCPNGLYALAGSSAAYGWPMNFPHLLTNWGPPGFVIPASTNHSC